MSDRDLFTRLCEIIDRQRVSEWQGGIHPEDVGHLARALIAAGVTMPAPRALDTGTQTALGVWSVPAQIKGITCPKWVRGTLVRCVKTEGHEGECW